jgi:SAM-dependent methyltransferase
MWQLSDTPGSYIIDRRRRSIDLAHREVAPVESVAECAVSEKLTVWIGEFERGAVIPKSFSVGDQEFRRLLDRFHLPAVPDSALSVALFDLCANAYDRIVDVKRNVSNIHNLLRVALAAGPRSADLIKVLDFGCGTGLSFVALQSFESKSAGRIQVTGMDRSPHMLQIAARRGLPILAAADWTHLLPATFDAVIASYVIHLGLSQDDCRTIAKQLRAGGVFVANYHHGDATSVGRAAALLSGAGLHPIPLPAGDAGTPVNPTILFGRAMT